MALDSPTAMAYQTEVNEMDATANFETIYRSHISLVRKIIASFRIYNGLADDLAQQAFLQAFVKLLDL